MKSNELYNMIQSALYRASGLSVDWDITYSAVENAVILLFQGSNQKEDWKINLDFPAKVYKHQESAFMVHRGYKKAWKSCNDEIVEIVHSYLIEHDTSKLIIAGHSY